MSDYLGGATAFSMEVDIDIKVILKQGQKVQLSALADAVKGAAAGAVGSLLFGEIRRNR